MPNPVHPATLTADPNCRHPFTNNIIEVPLPEKWKGFNRDRYDGSTDLDEHMDAYTTHMSLYTSDNAVLCRVFPTSLKGAALSWFTKLSPNSIDSFATLVAKFETQFATSRPHHLTSIALVGIRQEKGESMRTFVDRFSKVAMSIWNLSPDVAMHPMLTALRRQPVHAAGRQLGRAEEESCQIHAAGRAKRVPQPGPRRGWRREEGRKGPPRAADAKKMTGDGRIEIDQSDSQDTHP